jgi:hypothetical protein
MTVEMIPMKMNVVAPVHLKTAGVAGKTPRLKTLIGFGELALIKAKDLPKTTHLGMKMVGDQFVTIVLIIFARYTSLSPPAATGETTIGTILVNQTFNECAHFLRQL